MKAVGDLDQGFQCIRDPEGAQIVRGGEDHQAVGLETPELVVLDEIVQLLDQVVDAPLVRAGRLQLSQRLLGQVLEQDAIGVRFGADRRGGQDDGHRDVVALVGKIGELVGGRKIEIEHEWSLRW